MSVKKQGFRRTFNRKDYACMPGTFIGAASGIAHMAASRFRTTVYQLRANVVCRDGMEKAYSRLIDVVLRFAGKSVKAPLPAEAEQHLSFEITDDDFHCECRSIPERLLWTVSFFFTEKNKVTWIYNVSMVRKEDKLLFGLKIETSPKADVRPMQSDLPLLKALLDTGLLALGKTLADNFLPINTPEEVDRLVELLQDKNRTMPVIAVSETNSNSQYQPSYLINAEYLAKQVKGFAIVARLTRNATFALSDRVSKAWSVFDGATRTYYPMVDFENGFPPHHPCNLKDKIKYWVYKEKHGPDAHLEFLIEVAHQAVAKNWTDWRGLYFVEDAKILDTELAFAQDRNEANSPEREQNMQNHIVALQQKLQSAQEENEQWLNELMEATEATDYYKQENAALRMRLNALLAHMDRQDADALSADVPIPASFDEMRSWVKTYLAGQLLLHPRAERALNKAVYEDVASVYRALLILANEYRDSRMGTGSDQAFKEALAQNGMEIGGSIDKCRAGQEGDAYYVNYPIGTANREFLQFHLTKGTCREDRYCMRIYFFWDDDTHQVVVGWLPSHLNNRIS